MDGLDLLATVACAHLDNELGKDKVDGRPTFNQCIVKYDREVRGTTSNIRKWQRGDDKGAVGHEAERLLGIPKSSDCNDCSPGAGEEFGEVKTLEVLKVTPRTRKGKEFGLGVGDYVPKENVAITMVDFAELIATPFKDSRMRKKIHSLLFLPNFRPNNDSIVWLEPTIFTASHPLYAQFYAQIEREYEAIRQFHHDYYKENRNYFDNTKTESLIEIRTKGQGRKAKRRHAFYFTPGFLIPVLHPSN